MVQFPFNVMMIDVIDSTSTAAKPAVAKTCAIMLHAGLAYATRGNACAYQVHCTLP